MMAPILPRFWWKIMERRENPDRWIRPPFPEDNSII
jgi:hypothetical protein